MMHGAAVIRPGSHLLALTPHTPGHCQPRLHTPDIVNLAFTPRTVSTLTSHPDIVNLALTTRTLAHTNAMQAKQHLNADA
eukprot:366422-Chlamydomonas_euryale.AAC.2